MGGFGSAASLAAEGIRVLSEGPGYAIVTFFLALVFAWSGVAKVRRPALAAMAIVDFGVTRRARLSLGFLVGAGELVLASALAFGGPLSRLALVCAAVLLWVFTFLIARSLLSGERFACFCFGDAGQTLSRWTFVRTASLAVLASVPAVAAGPLGAYRGSGADSVIEICVAVSSLGTIVLLSRVADLMRWNHDLLEPGIPSIEEDR